jgi:hypothetical protein
MRKLGVIALAATLWVTFLAAAAYAQYPPSKPMTPYTGGGSSAGDVAFTGANISLGLMVIVGLVVVGTLLLLAARHRKTRVP